MIKLKKQQKKKLMILITILESKFKKDVNISVAMSFQDNYLYNCLKIED